MKAKTKLQKKVVELFSHLPEITEKQLQKGFEKGWGWRGYLCKGDIWCTHCGEVFSSDLNELAVSVCDNIYIVCPHCGKRIKVEKSRKKSYNVMQYVCYMTTFKGLQVFRYLLLCQDMKKGQREPFRRTLEAFQVWMDEKGSKAYISRSVRAFPKYSDDWFWQSPLELKSGNSYSYSYGYYGGYNRYNITPNVTFVGGVLPILRQRGIKSSVMGTNPVTLCTNLIKGGPVTESLFKMKQSSLLRYHLNDGGGSTVKFMYAIKIANRHHYKVSDANLWMDMIRSLEELGKDTHNPEYICPKDLKKAHDKWQHKVEAVRAKKRLEEKKAEAVKWEKLYAESKGAFIGLCFDDGKVFISVLPSVAAFAEEGSHMHHCVFANSYYKKEDALIMSARDKMGNRLETVEVSIKNLSIVQSRAVNNGISEAHDEIISLVNKFMPEIARRANSGNQQKIISKAK